MSLTVLGERPGLSVSALVAAQGRRRLSKLPTLLLAMIEGAGRARIAAEPLILASEREWHATALVLTYANGLVTANPQEELQIDRSQ
jgi:hypothetical protein